MPHANHQQSPPRGGQYGSPSRYSATSQTVALRGSYDTVIKTYNEWIRVQPAPHSPEITALITEFTPYTKPIPGTLHSTQMFTTKLLELTNPNGEIYKLMSAASAKTLVELADSIYATLPHDAAAETAKLLSELQKLKDAAAAAEKLRADEEAARLKARAEEDARQKAAEEARKLAEETAKQQAAEEARQKEAEEAKKLKATEEARLKAKEENETKSKVQEDINHLNGIHKDSSTPIAQKRNFIKDHLKDVEDRDEKFQFILNITEKKSIFSSTKEAKWGDDSIKHYCETAAIIKQFSDNNNKMMLDGVVTRYEMQ